MPRSSDVTSRVSAAQQRRIEWGQRRRQVSQIIGHPERYLTEASDPAELWEIVLTGLYVAEAEAERVALPAALVDILQAKSAAAKLWSAFAGEGEAAAA